METLNQEISGETNIESLKLQVWEKEEKLKSQYSLLKQIYEQYEILKKENEELRRKLNDYKLPPDGYNSSWSWISKIVFMIKTQNRPLKSSELIDLLECREPNLKEHYSKIQYFSAFLSKAVEYKRVTRYKIKGVRGFYYCLPEWVDKDGTLAMRMANKIV
jgi:hypothetical protein